MLPKSYPKLVAAQFSKDFRAAAQIVEADYQAPAAGQIVVRNIYAGVNATDVNISAGLYTPGVPPPIDLGAEAVGQVVELGAGVEHLKVGDYVVTGSLGGGYRAYGLHEARYALPVDEPRPEYLSIILSGLTAAFGLNVVGEMGQGETVLVTAAAGGTGQYAVQLAKLAGNHVIGTCGSTEKAAFLKDLGCDRVINYREEDFGAVIREEYREKLDIVYESVGGDMFDIALRNLAVRGRLVIIGYISEYKQAAPEKITDIRVYNRLLAKSASVRGMFLNHYMKHAAEELPKLMGLYLSGQIKVQVDPTLFEGLDAVPDAVDYLHSGRNVGKVVVKLG